MADRIFGSRVKRERHKNENRTIGMLRVRGGGRREGGIKETFYTVWAARLGHIGKVYRDKPKEPPNLVLYLV